MGGTKVQSSPCSPTSSGAADCWLSGTQGLQDPGLMKPTDKVVIACNEEVPNIIVPSLPVFEFHDGKRFPHYIPTQIRTYRCPSDRHEQPQAEMLVKLSFPQDKVIPEQSQQHHDPCQDDQFCEKIHVCPHDLSQGQQILKQIQQEQDPPQAQQCPVPRPPVCEECVESPLVSSKSKKLDCSLAAEIPLQSQLICTDHRTSRPMHAQDISCVTDAHSFRAHREKPLSSPESVGATKSKCLQNNIMQQKGSNPHVAAPFKVETTKSHIMAERKRREKLSQQFIALSALLPNLKKMDKATILGDTVKLVKHLQERLKFLEDQACKKRSLAVKPSQASTANHDDDTSSVQQGTVQVRINGNNVFIRAHCIKKSTGMLVKLVSELENMELSVTHTSVLSFSDVALDVTFIAQMEEGCKVTEEYIMKSFNNSLSAILQ